MYERPCKLYWVYIMASRPRGVLYVGMTSDRPGRAWQHRERVREGFTKRCWAGRLVYFERHEDPPSPPGASAHSSVGGAIGKKSC
jgi:predicted GIY-YIG superfamily endonuclease